MNDVLADIVAHKRGEVADAMTRRPLEQLKDLAKATAEPRNFFRALTHPRESMAISSCARSLAGGRHRSLRMRTSVRCSSRSSFVSIKERAAVWSVFGADVQHRSPQLI